MAVLTLITGVLVVPEVRRFLALDDTQREAAGRSDTIKEETAPAASESVPEAPSLAAPEEVVVTDPPIEPLQLTSAEETPASSTPSESTQVVLASEEEAGFRFDLLACRRSISEVTCDFLITNSWNDRYMTLCARCFANISRMIDTDGNEYHGQIATLGADRSEQPQAALASGVPLKASMTFGGARAASAVKLLEVGIRVRGRDGGNFAVRFHDISLAGI